MVDLSPALAGDVAMRRLGSHALEFLGTDGRPSFAPVLPPNPAEAFGMNTIEVLSHLGSHLDAPARLLLGGERPGQVALDRLVGPARVVDLRWHTRYGPLQITDLEQSAITKGDVVLLLVGYEPPAENAWPQQPTLSTQAAEWLVAKGIRALGTDMPTLIPLEEIARRLRLEQRPQEVWAEYLPLFQAQVPVIAGLVNLDAVAGEPHVAFVGLPLPVVEGNGAPVRAVALVY